jgi:hypothetical protein
MPYTSTWGHRFSFSKIDLSKLPFLGFFVTSEKKGVADIFGDDSVSESADLQVIYLLQKSTKDAVTKAELDDELMRKIMAIQRNEFSYFKNPLIRAYEYHNELDVDAIYDTERRNIKKLLSAKDIYLVEAKDYMSFSKMIEDHQAELVGQDT